VTVASAVTHPAVALALVPWFRTLPWRDVLPWGIAVSLLPDLDVVAFFFGIPYEHVLGHRGLSHSIPFAVAVGAFLGLTLRRRLMRHWFLTGAYFSLCMILHDVLDAMTNGGLGIAFFAPFSNRRFFLPFCPLEVSPIGVSAFFSGWGRAVMASEVKWVWAPALLVFGLGLARRRAGQR
jgi:inner membrane protein